MTGFIEKLRAWRLWATFGIFTSLLAGCASLENGQAREPTLPTEELKPAAVALQETLALDSAPSAGQPSSTLMPFRAALEDYGPAPELENKVWINTGQPLRLAALRGQVVLLDMWTFG